MGKRPMRKLVSLLIGLALGATVGAALVMLFAPTSGAQLIEDLKRGYLETMSAARQASAARRAELEAELEQMQKQRSLPERTA